MTKDWETKRLGDVCDFEGGSQPPKSTFIFQPRKGYVRFLQIRDFGSDKHITYIPESKKNRLCVEEDVLLGRYGASVGKVLTGKSGAYNVALMKTIPNERVLDKKYFYFYLVSDDFQVRLLNVASRSAQDGFSKNDINDFPVVVPPLSEQRRIVSILDEAFAALAKAKANAERNLQNAKELFESYLQEVFNDLRGRATFESLGDVCETGAGGTPLKSHKEYYEGGTIPWLLSGEVSQGDIYKATHFITKQGLDNSSAKLFPKDTVLVAMYGATAGQVGILRFGATTNQAVCGILPNDKMIPEFLFYCFLSKKKELIAQAIGNAQPNISQIKIKNTRIPIIPKKEQKLIVDKLQRLSKESSKLENLYLKKINSLEELKKSLLQKAFNGELKTAVRELA